MSDLNEVFFKAAQARRKAKEKAAKSPYARVVLQTGPGNEYDYDTKDYYIVVCNPCGLRTKRLGDAAHAGNGWNGNYGYDAAQRAADEHNAKYHAHDTGALVAKPSAEIVMHCGHVYPEHSDKSGTCNALMRLCKDEDNPFDKPVFVCGNGHYNSVPHKVGKKTLEKAIEDRQAEFQKIHKDHRLLQKIAKLEK